MTPKPDNLDSLFDLIGQPVPSDLSSAAPNHVSHTCVEQDGRAAASPEYVALRLTPEQASWLRQHLAALRLDWFMQQRNLRAVRQRGEYLSPEAQRLLDSLVEDLDASQPVLAALEAVTR